MRYAALAYLIIRKVVPIISEIIDKPNKARSINIKSPNVMPMIIIKPRLNPDENVRAITAKTAGGLQTKIRLHCSAFEIKSLFSLVFYFFSDITRFRSAFRSTNSSQRSSGPGKNIQASRQGRAGVYVLILLTGKDHS